MIYNAPISHLPSYACCSSHSVKNRKKFYFDPFARFESFRAPKPWNPHGLFAHPNLLKNRKFVLRTLTDSTQNWSNLSPKNI